MNICEKTITLKKKCKSVEETAYHTFISFIYYLQKILNTIDFYFNVINNFWSESLCEAKIILCWMLNLGMKDNLFQPP